MSATTISTAQVQFQCLSISPILMNNPNGMAKREGPKVGGDKIPTPQEEATRSLYVDDDGLYFPAAGFRNALLTAARDITFKAGGRGRPKKLSTILSGTLFAVGDRVRLCSFNGKRQQLSAEAWELDVRRARPQGKMGGAILRGRPMVRQWSAVVKFEYLPEYLGTDIEAVLLDAFTRAGLLVGVGNFRPECNGPMGRWTTEAI